MTTTTQRINPWKLFVGAMLPNWLLERPEVSPGAKLVYARLCQFAGRDGVCCPRQSVLAAEVGVAERSVRNHLEELTGLGLLEIVQIGLKCANRYAFLWHPWMEVEVEAGPANLASQDRQTLPVKTGKPCQSRPAGFCRS